MFTPFKIAVVVIIILIIFGPALLPRLGRQLGALFTGAKEFRDELTRESKSDDEQPPKKSDPQ